jgi:hypothetical protein
LVAVAIALGACTAPVQGEPDAGPVQDAPFTGDNCGDEDPLTFAAADGWVGFCDDRVDDNCHVDAPLDPCPTGTSQHNYCRTGDEPCPATQAASAPPAWDCQGAPPANVIAHGYYASADNPNVT